MLKSIYQYFSFEPEDARAFKVIRLFFFGTALILFAWFLYFSVSTIIMPYQIEYREGAALVMTQILLKGGNPFSLEYQPLGMNNYGIGYSLVVFPFAKLFGNTLSTHRSVNFFFLLASLFLITRTLWTIKKDVLISVLGGLLIAVILAGRGGLGAFPSTMGAFLFLAAILIPCIYSFSNSSLIISAFLSIAAYYTKPYFVIGFGVVAMYTFVFVSKRKAIGYSLFFITIFTILFLGVRYVFKLYFINTVLSNLSNASRSSARLLGQLIEIGVEFYPVILLISLLLFFNFPNFSAAHAFLKGLSSRLSFLQFDAPLLKIDFNYFAFIFLFCFSAFISVLGLHTGNYMTYAYQLMLPPFILWVCHKLNSKNRFSIIAFGLLLVNLLILENILLKPAFLRQRDSAAWRALYTYVANTRSAVNSPVVTSALIEAGVLPVDSGQTEYYYNVDSYANNKLFGPVYETFEANGAAYRKIIQQAVISRQFDRIFTTNGYGNAINLEVISRHYTQVDTLTVDMPQVHQTWIIGVWEPQEK
ncbi:MAG: hypothetical protein IPP66_04130 [Anaerolineales bacterium]|nr:hypothetical protein [Anaerolineales bacterium]